MRSIASLLVLLAACYPVPCAAAQPSMPLVQDAPVGEFQLTKDSIVTLDGLTCSYDDVPDNAVIVLIELSEDARMIVQIHFRTRC